MLSVMLLIWVQIQILNNHLRIHQVAFCNNFERLQLILGIFHVGRPLRVLNFRKTVSMDAIHTGGKGHVRSDPWIKDANLKQFQNGK